MIRSLTLTLVLTLCGAHAAHAAADLPANTWVPIEVDEATPLKEFLGEKKGRWVTSDGFSDNTYREKTGNVLIRTGIECADIGYKPGFYTNATVEWDLKSDTLKVVEVANWGGGSSGSGTLLPAYKDHRTPSPRHTYDTFCYEPTEDAEYLLFGAYGRMLNGNPPATAEAKAEIIADKNYTWKFDFKTARWTRIDSSPTAAGLRVRSPYEHHMTYWPEGKKLIFLDNDGKRYAEFNAAEGKWEATKGELAPTMRLYEARSAWDSKRGLWVFRCGPRLCTFDPKTKTFTQLPDCWDIKPLTDDEKKAQKKAGKKGDPRRSWQSIAYISKHDRYLITGPNGNDTAVYDPETNKWTPIQAGDIKLPWAYCQYNAELDVIAMNRHLKCFKFRYVPEQ